MEPPWLDDLTDDLHSISFNSTTDSTATSTDSTTTKHHHSSSLTLTDIHFLHRLGSGDIGSVYLAKLKSPPSTPTLSPQNISAANVIDEENLSTPTPSPQNIFAEKVLDRKELSTPIHSSPNIFATNVLDKKEVSTPAHSARNIFAKKVLEKTELHTPALSSRNMFAAKVMDTKEVSPSPCLFAAKVMDKKEVAIRNKERRAKVEKEILEMLDHPFLPKLLGAFETSKWSCLLTEFCNGGDLHVLRQRQPCRRFTESVVRFYASEVIVALEYLHMLGIVYRDLKPENVLVRSGGHIMLTDFDLSLKCDLSMSTPAQVFPNPNQLNPPLLTDHHPLDPPKFTSASCILPRCIVPSVSCFNPKFKRKKKPANHNGPEFVAEPVDVRSMSFVGTYEYLAPEIVSGEGHGSAVDWWTLGIFIFELFYGVTPFKGIDNELTLANIVARALEFPKEPVIPTMAKDLISQLLAKDPHRRMGSTMGASAIKHHPFFQGVNWALLRCTTPPFVPPPFSYQEVTADDGCPNTPVEYY